MPIAINRETPVQRPPIKDVSVTSKYDNSYGIVLNRNPDGVRVGIRRKDFKEWGFTIALDDAIKLAEALTELTGRNTDG